VDDPDAEPCVGSWTRLGVGGWDIAPGICRLAPDLWFVEWGTSSTREASAFDVDGRWHWRLRDDALLALHSRAAASCVTGAAYAATLYASGAVQLVRDGADAAEHPVDPVGRGVVDQALGSVGERVALATVDAAGHIGVQLYGQGLPDQAFAAMDHPGAARVATAMGAEPAPWGVVAWAAADGVYAREFSQGAATRLSDAVADGIAVTATPQGPVVLWTAAGEPWLQSVSPQGEAGPPRRIPSRGPASAPAIVDDGRLVGAWAVDVGVEVRALDDPDEGRLLIPDAKAPALAVGDGVRVALAWRSRVGNLVYGALVRVPRLRP
jgi:hypothetical protein